MQVLIPTAVTAPMLVSSTATETVALWAAGTAYAVGARALRTTTNRIYERVVAGTTPTTPESDVTNWFDYGPSNTWACLDAQVSTRTTANTSLVITLATGTIDSLAILNLVGVTARLQVRDGLGGTVVFDDTQGLDGNVLTDWYQYFYSDPLVLRNSVVWQNIPLYASSHATLTLTASGALALGQISFGRMADLGYAQYGASVGIVDYSVKSTDAFGNTTFVKRAFSKRLNVELMLENTRLNRVQNTLYNLRATPALWLATDVPSLAEPLLVFGFYKDFSTVVQYATQSLCSLEIEGLI